MPVSTNGFGTDTKPSGRFPGFFDEWEMELMVEGGLTPMQVIVAATGTQKSSWAPRN